MHTDYPTFSEIRKIAVLRANGLGDAIFALPALEALRAAYPGAELVLLAQETIGAFLAARPGPVSRAVAVPPSRGVNEAGGSAAREDAAELERFFAAMVAERFDLAVQLHGGGRHSNPFLLRLGARHTVGVRSVDAAPLERSIPYVFYQSEVLRWLEVAALAGARPLGIEPRLAVTPADLAEAAPLLPDDGAPLVALHPGAGDPRRRWPVEQFAALGDALAAAGAHVIISGSASEAELTAAVAARMGAAARDLSGRLSLGGLAGALSRCRVVVSNDSGPLHLAAAVGAATVGIYWCGNLITAGPATRTRHRPALSWRLDCPVCGVDCTRASCAHQASFVADVPLAEVRDSALELLELSY